MPARRNNPKKRRWNGVLPQKEPPPCLVPKRIDMDATPKMESLAGRLTMPATVSSVAVKEICVQQIQQPEKDTQIQEPCDTDCKDDQIGWRMYLDLKGGYTVIDLHCHNLSERKRSRLLVAMDKIGHEVIAIIDPRKKREMSFWFDKEENGSYISFAMYFVGKDNRVSSARIKLNFERCIEPKDCRMMFVKSAIKKIVDWTNQTAGQSESSLN
jgi:hypothetical protein